MLDDIAARRTQKPHAGNDTIQSREAQQILGISRTVLLRLAKVGQLPAKLLDSSATGRRRWVYKRADVLELKGRGGLLKRPPRLHRARVAWRHYFGPVPEGFTPIPRDGHTNNTAPENLALVPLRSTIRARRYRMRRRRQMAVHRWNAQERKKLRKEYAHRPTSEIANEIGASVIAVRNQALKMRLRKSRQFLSQIARDRRNAPIGTERRDINGRNIKEVFVKVSNEGSWAQRWRRKHHVIWEKANGKKVPPGFRVIFKDGNKENFDPGNLELTTLEAVSAKAFAKFLSYPAPLKSAIRLTKKLEREVARKRSGQPDESPRQRSMRRPGPGRRWTAAMDARVRKEFPNRTTVELAKALKVTRISLIARARRLGVYRSPDAMVRLANKKAAAAIAQAFGEG